MSASSHRSKTPKRLFISATRQNDGKTTLSLGLMNILISKLGNVGFIKPVGQRYVEVDGYKVDEDSVLIKNANSLKTHIKHMSPVAIERGFTENYIKGKNVKKEVLVKRITDSFKVVVENNQLVVIEGTGHAGVGSVIGCSNAEVAKLLDSKVIMVARGGIGNPIDRILLNKALFDSHDVTLQGVIINKVIDKKYDKIKNMVTKGLAHHNIDVFGVIPYRNELSSPTIRHVIEAFDARVISGTQYTSNIINKIVVGAMEPHNIIDYFEDNTLIITPGDRNDIILATISAKTLNLEKENVALAGIVLTGGFKPHRGILELIKKSELPILFVKEDIYTVASRIHDLLVKIHPSDIEKIETSKELINQYVDIDAILDRL